MAVYQVEPHTASDNCRGRIMCMLRCILIGSLLGACTGNAPPSDSVDTLWTQSVRDELEQHVGISINSATSFHSDSSVRAGTETLDVSDFVGSLKEIVRYTVVEAIPEIARSGEFDGASFDTDHAELLSKLDRWVANSFVYREPIHQKYVSSLLTVVLRPPETFNSVLRERFGENWMQHRFDEIYDKYYVELAYEWLRLTSASKPSSLEIN